MKLINRTILVELFTVTAEGVILFSFVFLLKRLFNITGLLVTGGADFISTFKILFSLLPSVMLLTLPMAILLGSLMVYGRMASDQELTALQAAGYSVKQLLIPALLFGLVLSMLLLWWGHRIAPKGLRIINEVASEVLQNTATAGIQPGKYNLLGGYIIFCSSIQNEQMRHVRIFEKRDDQIAGVVSAPTGTIHYKPETNSISFRLEEGMLHQTPASNRDVVIRFDEMFFSINIPKLLRQMIRVGSNEYTLRYKDLRQNIENYQEAYQSLIEGSPLTQREKQLARYYFKEMKEHEVEIVRRIILPTACLLMAGIGALLGMRSRYGKRSASYAITIAVIFVYYILMSFAETSIIEGDLSAWLGMWIPNIISLIVGLILYWRTSQV